MSDAAAEIVSAAEASAGERVGPTRGRTAKSRGDRPSTRAPGDTGAESGAAPLPPVDISDIERWRPAAESIVLEGVTSKPARLVATILALREAGASAYDIGRHHNVHHTTVGKIVSAAEVLTA